MLGGYNLRYVFTNVHELSIDSVNILYWTDSYGNIKVSTGVCSKTVT